MITVKIIEPTDKITLNVASLKISEVAYAKHKVDVNWSDSNHTYVAITSEYKYDSIYGEFTILLDEPGEIGEEYRIFIVFEGKIGTGKLGLNAMLDEKLNKSGYTYRLKLEYPGNWTALSNMDAETSHISPGEKDITGTARFKLTPKMPTYLLSFAIGPFISYHTTTRDGGVAVRAWGVPSDTVNEHRLEYIAKMAANCLDAMREYTGVKYPLEKLDNVVIPNDNYPGEGEEFWGIIMYREASIEDWLICHEVAHMWFGDLVTVDTWEELFVKEGWATYFEDKARKMVDPSMSGILDVDAVITKFDNAMQAEEAIKLSNSVENLANMKIINRNLRRPVFSGDDYQKPGSLFYMLADLIGDEAMKTVLNAFLTNNAYGSATHKELLDAFNNTEEANNIIYDWCGEPLNVTKFLLPYLEQAAFPIVSVKIVDGKYRFTQRFEYDVPSFNGLLETAKDASISNTNLVKLFLDEMHYFREARTQGKPFTMLRLVKLAELASSNHDEPNWKLLDKVKELFTLLSQLFLNYDTDYYTIYHNYLQKQFGDFAENYLFNEFENNTIDSFDQNMRRVILNGEIGFLLDRYRETRNSSAKKTLYAELCRNKIVENCSASGLRSGEFLNTDYFHSMGFGLISGRQKITPEIALTKMNETIHALSVDYINFELAEFASTKIYLDAFEQVIRELHEKDKSKIELLKKYHEIIKNQIKHYPRALKEIAKYIKSKS
ncbi:hypothetical protein WR25_15162 [Diploscapter pachys]|uniref:Peptidase M1 membrane alanine aminopeptidase domain-containing protein n=1 Tax=Diploscapter pachys TaxID=2018661 RepID=A0A2A2KNU1_9BILA|nr:hypothetical protein WR25_15162 [Diploscapter pachys]